MPSSANEVTTVIDPDLCTGCELCINVCPSDTLAMRDGKAVVVGELSLQCGHCVAVCPVGAVTVGALDPDMRAYRTFQAESDWLAPGKTDLPGLVQLMESRRSCRNFKPTPVSRDMLEDLVRIACSAPSGTNSQRWAFTVIPDRPAMKALGERLLAFFDRLNTMAANPVIRTMDRVFGKGRLGVYHREYRERVAEGIAEYRRGGRDRLFHGATAAIVITSRPGATTAVEDALLASQNILLAAHAMGLGTCLVGFAVEAMTNDRNLQKTLGIPERERVYSVIALGHSSERFQTVTGRRTVPIRWVA
jgi:nitroreductase/NAD-dependent dihydropyrimidine dehydrogenase PreA subunit